MQLSVLVEEPVNRTGASRARETTNCVIQATAWVKQVRKFVNILLRDYFDRLDLNGIAIFLFSKPKILASLTLFESWTERMKVNSKAAAVLVSVLVAVFSTRILVFVEQ